jgi:hypothetical protein
VSCRAVPRAGEGSEEEKNRRGRRSERRGGRMKGAGAGEGGSARTSRSREYSPFPGPLRRFLSFATGVLVSAAGGDVVGRVSAARRGRVGLCSCVYRLWGGDVRVVDVLCASSNASCVVPSKCVARLHLALSFWRCATGAVCCRRSGAGCVRQGGLERAGCVWIVRGGHLLPL